MHEGNLTHKAQNGADGHKQSGRLDLSFARDPHGRTFIDRQFASYPFHVCRPFYLDESSSGEKMATIYIQSCAGGLYTQDRLRTSIIAQPDTQVHLTTQASTIVHSGTRGSAQHIMEVTAQENALIEYLPEPTILFPNAHLVSKVSLTVSETSRAILFDSFLAHDFSGENETFNILENDVRIYAQNGAPLVVERYRISGKDYATGTVGQMGRFLCHGSVIVIAPGVFIADLMSNCRTHSVDPCEAMIGISKLPCSNGLSARILSKDAITMKYLMTHIWELSREAMTGSRPQPRRK